MRILITGGFGFIGGRIAQFLQIAGHSVILGSRNDRPVPKWLSDAQTAQTNWLDIKELEGICQGVDVIVHTAGMNAKDCASDHVAALEFNGVATARLLEASINAGVQRFIFLSSAHVYLDPLVGVITEKNFPRNLHPYATSNLAGEYVVLRAHNQGKIEGITLRLSNSFGAPMHKDANCWMLLVNDLCRQAVQSSFMELNSRGNQQRDFVPLSDVCHVIECMVSRNAESLKFQIFNLGSGVSQTIFQMAQLIQKRCKQILSFEPELRRPEPNSLKRQDSLMFKGDNLIMSGIYVNHDSEAEIDRLLIFCKKAFSI